MKRRYKNPPIIEAVCEIHFETASPLTPEQIETIGALWKEGYPEQHFFDEKNLELQINLELAQVKTQDKGKKLIARTKDGSRITQHAATFLAVNQISPYRGWTEAFRADILARLAESLQVSGYDRTSHVNLRYIDRLDIPQRPIVWKEWLAIGLPLPPSLPDSGGQIQTHFDREIEGGLHVICNLATLPKEKEDVTSIILDTIVAWNQSTPLNDIELVLEKVHAPHPQLFNGLLTPKTQALLGIYEVE
jgi:uncharacterized protein (TIGR04255 family)